MGIHLLGVLPLILKESYGIASQKADSMLWQISNIIYIYIDGGGRSVNRCCHVCLCFQVLIAYMAPVHKHVNGCESQ